MTTGQQVTTERLRVLAADEDEAALRRTAAQLEELGHVVTSFVVDVDRAATLVAQEDPDLAVVVVHRDDEHALGLIEQIGAYASGPVVAQLDEEDPEFARRAAERGLDAVARSGSLEALQAAIEVAMRRYRETERLAERIDQLEGALDRRAVIERAKGIVMERHSTDEQSAFELLRAHARSNNRTVVDTARAVVDGHALLPPR